MISKKIFFLLFIITYNMFAFQNNDLEKAKALLENRKIEESKTLLENILDKNDQAPEAYFLLGKVFMALNEPEEAVENFEEAVNLEKNNADYHFWLGQAIAMDAQNSNIISQAMMASDILEEFERALEINPNHIPAKNGVIGFYINAPSIMGGDIDKAILNAKELIQLDEIGGRVALVQIYLKQDKIDSAEAEIKILENKYADDKSLGRFYNSLGYYYLKTNELNKAIEAFEKQVKIYPNSANAHDSLGDGYKAAGRLNDAMIQYKKALEINPEFSASKNNLEELKELLNDKEN